MAASRWASRSAFSVRRVITSSTALVMRSSRLARASSSCCEGLMSLLRVSGFGLFHQGGEGCCLVGGQIRENLAVQLDAGFFQPADELAVGKTGGAATSSDADDPQRAEIAFFPAASDVSIFLSLFDGLLGGPVQFALGEKKSRRARERLLA